METKVSLIFAFSKEKDLLQISRIYFKWIVSNVHFIILSYNFLLIFFVVSANCFQLPITVNEYSLIEA